MPELRGPFALRETQQGLDQDSGEGGLYIAELAKEVQQSDRIVVTEHSNVDDMLDPETQPQRPAAYIPVIYATRELSDSQRKNFLDSIQKIEPRTQDAEPACIFEPHHTITFFREGKQTSAMRICFQCGQVQWDGTRNQRPWALAPTLKATISGLGMEAERDWRTLAKAGAR
jgi:hypothetical protein